jgi:hypothetical protein
MILRIRKTNAAMESASTFKKLFKSQEENTKVNKKILEEILKLKEATIKNKSRFENGKRFQST